VKVQGYRIELGEVEAVLREAEEVEQAVVVAVGEERGQKHLIAYVVPSRKHVPSLFEMERGQRAEDQVFCESVVSAGGRQVQKPPPNIDLAACSTLMPQLDRLEPASAEQFQAELRGFLRQKLPEYMVPSKFVLLDKLPLTANGKVDQKALPVPESYTIGREEAFETTRTPVEEALASIWTETLGVKKVGIHDNFFELGGNSLLAVHLVAGVRKAFQVELSLPLLFERPTVAGLAESIETIRWAAQGLQSTVSTEGDREEGEL
jgi:acyl carrier protein